MHHSLGGLGVSRALPPEETTYVHYRTQKSKYMEKLRFGYDFLD